MRRDVVTVIGGLVDEAWNVSLGVSQLAGQLRDADNGDRPDLVRVHSVVVVSQQMTKVHHVTPPHLRMDSP